jgi:hypothetical protein
MPLFDDRDLTVLSFISERATWHAPPPVDILAIKAFVDAAEHLRPGSRADLLEIERALNGRQMTLRGLFPWLEMQGQAELLRTWTAEPTPGAGRPRRSVDRSLRAIDDLLRERQVGERVAIMLTAERQRLYELRSSLEVDRRSAGLFWMDGTTVPVKKGRRKGLPPKWRGYIRYAYALLRRGGRADALVSEELHRIVIALFPQYFPLHPGDPGSLIFPRKKRFFGSVRERTGLTPRARDREI